MMLYTERNMTNTRTRKVDGTRKESMELMLDKKFMESYKRARNQIKRREFAEWDYIGE